MNEQDIYIIAIPAAICGIFYVTLKIIILLSKDRDSEDDMMLPEDDYCFDASVCDICGGHIKQNKLDLNLWECDSCDYTFISKGMEGMK